jgi:hypothetical protein
MSLKKERKQLKVIQEPLNDIYRISRTNGKISLRREASVPVG